MKTLQQLVNDIEAGLTPDLPDVIDAINRYPYFTLPAVTLLRNPPVQLPDDIRRRLTNLVAINSAATPDRIALTAEPHAPEAPEPFYPDSTPRRVNTTDAIDTFLNTYGSMTPEEDAMLERMIFNPTPDYANILDREERSNNPIAGEAAPGSADDRINTFIINQKKQSGEIASPPSPPAQTATPPALPRKRPTPQNPQYDAPLSLSLAKIFIKQHHYERAYEIISQLNLNYPKKSVYFADQLRFLRKVIAIQKAKNNKSQQ